VKLLTLARDLQRRRGRERQRRFVAEGVRTVEALLASPLAVTGLVTTAGARADARAAALLHEAAARGLPVAEVTDAEFASASDTDTPQGVLAIAAIPERSLAAPSGGGRYLLLDALQDPGNVGTVIRTAAAFGVTATLALPGTVDLWNAKVVRSAMGTLFTHRALAVGWEEASAFLAAHDVALWAADREGDPLAVAATAAPARLALAVGNEGAGLSPPVVAAAARRVTIPMAPAVESLNVAVASGILLYALRPA
jgi:TrmH family RNA methyltransferase